MKKLITAFALISILAASSLPSWGMDNLIYVCYLEKKQQVRTVDTLSKCKRPEMAIALDKVESKTATGEEFAQRAQEVARKYPTWPQALTFTGVSGSNRISP